MELNLWPPAQAQETHGFRLSHLTSFSDLSHIYLSVEWGGCDPVWDRFRASCTVCGDHDGGGGRCDKGWKRRQAPSPSTHEFRPAYGLSDPQAKGHTQSLRPPASLVPPSFPLSAAAMPGSLPTSPWLQLQSLIKVNCDYFS